MKHSLPLARLGLVGCLALAGLTLGFAPPAEPTGAAMLVAVWNDAGEPLDGASVTALNADGGLKALPQGNGLYLFSDAGVQHGELIKTSIAVQHPAWGSAMADMLFQAAPTVRLELVFTDHDVVDAFSPQEIQGPSAGPGDGAPVNDDCGGALPVEVGVVTSGSTAGATVDGSEACGTSISAPGVWYSVTGTGNTMTASTCGAFFGYDTKVTVYCGDCDGLTCLGGNDDDCATGASSLLSTVSWCSQAGASYKILVHGFSSNEGPFELLVSDDGVACTGAVSCLPVGACCFDDGSCDQLTAAECAANGGTYNGDGVDCFTITDTSTYTSTPQAAIPDFDVGGLSDSLVVGDSFLIGDLDVSLTVDHTWQGDLIVTLTHEDTGTSVTVVDRIGVPASTFGCGEDNWNGVVLDDEAATLIENVCTPDLSSPPNLGPEQLLAAFDGEDMAGTWTLNISDNAEFDTGSLVSWSLIASEAGSPVCEQPECFLVIGDEPGTDSFFGAWHDFDTQVDDIAASYPVLMEDIPSFVLPPLQRGNPAVSQVLAQGAAPATGVEAWMQDGHFAVQVLMWNPQVFPGMPEQFTAGLEVFVQPNGTVQTVPYGDDLGGLTLEAQIDTLPDGTRVISFPFLIPGL